MLEARRLLVTLVVGSTLGAVLIGGGGRVVMRLLTSLDGREAGFSLGGTAEIVVCGALVGAGGSLVHAALQRLGWPRLVLGVSVGALTFAGTILTLPGHIAATAQPFRSAMPLVLALFGACFLAYGLALAAARPGGKRDK